MTENIETVSSNPDLIELRIVFQDDGGPANLRFVEVENIDGESVAAGTWMDRDDGLKALALTVHKSSLIDILTGQPILSTRARNAEPVKLYGPHGWINGHRGLNEEHWEVESDPLENNEEYFSIPLYAQVDPFREIGADGPTAAPMPAVPDGWVVVARADLLAWSKSIMDEDEEARALRVLDPILAVLASAPPTPQAETAPDVVEQKKWRKDGPVLRGIRLRFFHDLVPADRVKVYEVFGIGRGVLSENLNHGIESLIFDQLFATACQPVHVTDEMVPHEVALAGFYEAQKAEVKAKPLYDQCVAVYKAMRTAALTAAMGGEE